MAHTPMVPRHHFPHGVFRSAIATLVLLVGAAACGSDESSTEAEGLGGVAGLTGSGGASGAPTSSGGAGGAPTGNGGTAGRSHPPQLSCDSSACGGDPTGSWSIEEVCGELERPTNAALGFPDPACSGLVYSAQIVSDTRTLRFEAAGQMVRGGRIDAVFALEVDDACLATLELPAVPANASAEEKCELGVNLPV